MRLLFNFISFFLFLNFCSGGLANEYVSKYNIKTNGITIGEMFWEFKSDDKNYFIEVKLISRGFLSSLFRFNGYYKVQGKVKDSKFYPDAYLQNWETNKKKRDINIKFEKTKVVELTQEPKERERPRLLLEDISGYCDPLTSFINLLNGSLESNEKNLRLLLGAWTAAREFDKAIGVINILAPMINDGDLYIQKAMLLNEKGDWEGIKVASSEALNTGNLEKPGDIYILKGMAQTELEEYDQAINSFEKSIELGTDGNKRNAEAWIEYVSDRKGS